MGARASWDRPPAWHHIERPAFRKLCQGLRFPKSQGCPSLRANALKVLSNFKRLHLQSFVITPHPVHQSKRFTCGGRPRPPPPLRAAQILFSESPKLESALCGSVTRNERRTWRRKRTRRPPLLGGFGG